ncbi:hypothetical protein HQ590_02060, partial [bacterium]|nr:hypothetical protein [bacterium]
GWAPAAIGGAVLGLLICLQPDGGALVALFIGAFYLAHAIRAVVTTPRAVGPVLGKLALTVAVSAAVAAPTLQTMYATQIAGVQQGGSDDPRQKWAWATQWSLPPVETLDQVVPGFFGWRSDWARGPYWGRIGRQPGWEEHHQGFRNYSINANTVGTAVFLLALAATLTLIRRQQEPTDATTDLAPVQRWHGRFCVGAALIAYLLAFGRWAPFYYWFYQLPYMNTWRNPLKFLVVGNFCVVTLAVFGLHWWTTAAESGSSLLFRRAWRGVLIGAAVLLAVLWFTTVTGDAGPGSPLARAGYDAQQIQVIRSTQVTTVLVAMVIVGVLGVALWQCQPGSVTATAKPRRGTRSAGLTDATGLGRRLLVTAVVVTVVAQLFWVHRHYVEPVHFRQAYRSNALVDALRAERTPVRVKVLGADPLLHYHLTYLFPYYGIAALDVPAVSRMPDDYAAFFQALEKVPLRQWELAGVRFLAMPAGLVTRVAANLELQKNIEGAHLYRASPVPPDGFALQPVRELTQASHALVVLKDHLSKLSLVPGLEILEEQAAVSARLAAPEWDARATLVVDRATARAAELTATPAPAVAAGAVKLRHYSGRRIEAEVETGGPAYLLINDRFDPYWQATVNGMAVGVFRANLILSAVPVPAGRSEVVMQYRCPAVPVQTHLVALGLVGIALLIGWWRR